MFTRNCFKLLFLLSGISLFSQEAKPIQFTSGILFAPAGTNAFTEPQQEKLLHYENTYYFLMQLEELPGEAEKTLMENTFGLHFCSYLPSNTFYCTAERPLPTSAFARFGIRCIIPLEAKQKTDPSLLTHIAAGTPGQPVTLSLSLFEPGRAAEFRLRLMKFGYRVDFTPTYKPVIRVEITDTQLNTLCAFPFISYIEAAPDAPYTLNRFANTNHRDNLLNFSGPGGRNLQGDSVIIGEGDDGYIQAHLDHTPRLTNYWIPQNSDHPDHVAGTIAGAGNINPTYRGMAPKAKILADYFNAIQDDVPSFYPAYNMVLTSNSWGSTSGCSSKGIYTSSSASIDQQMRDYTKVLHVFAASNDGGNNCAPYTAGYHTIGSNENCAKNVLTVGALTSADAIASFSSRGPCNDGRIKPEVSAVGVNVTSTVRTNTYSVKSGTSMATPGTSGTIALLIQRYRQLHGYADADAALYKAILANTADDQGTAGPDYYYGFGRINARKAVECMEANRYFEGSASQSDSVSYSISVPSGASLLKVMLYWCDKDGNPAAAYSLVNNLDLKVYDPLSNLNKPLVLDYTPANCSLAAVQRTDTLNNIEQVSISSPASGSYLLVIRGTSVPFGPQNYKLVYDYYSPAVVLTYPVGNEKLISGGTETIYWDNTGITSGTFTLSYSTDSGATYTNIVTGLSSSTKSYTWTLPVVNSSACYVKITHSGGLYKDSCEADFTIAARPVTFAVNVCDRKARLSWAPVSGASAYRIYLIDSNLSGNILTLQDVTVSSCHISPLVNGKDYWFSVAAVFPTGYVSERAIALKATPSATACNDANDVGITYIASPVSGRANTSSALSATQVITVTIRNFSAGSISSIPVSYQVNGGATVTETYGGSIGANSTASFSFSTTADFSTLGTYTVKCFTGYASDATPTDDTLRVTVRHLANDTVSLPYLEDMELCTQGILLGNYIGANGMDRADFTTNTTTGRVRFAAGTGYTSSGIHSAVLDKSPTDATMTTNYLTYTFNLSHLTGAAYNPSLTFSFTQFGEESNAADSVWIRGADTQPFIPVYSLYANRTAAGVFKTSSVLDLKTLLAAQGQSLTSSFQLRFGQQDDSAAFNNNERDGIAIDDIRIFDLSYDVSVDSVTGPGSACTFPASTPITVKVKNNSGSTILNLPLAYSINGGSTVRDTVASIAAGTTIYFTFSTQANFSSPGNYSVKAWSEWNTDQYLLNDTFLLGTFTNFSLINTFPYKQNFETGTGNWISGARSGSLNSWEWGSPTKTQLNAAGSGSKCMVTKVSSFYPSNEDSYLQSPCIDFSALTSPRIAFLINFSTESAWDFAGLERSINGGVTWQKVDTTNLTQLYNASTSSSSYVPPGWSGSSGTWLLCQFPLNGMGGQSNCKLRFRFYSDGGVVDEGVAIDSIVIYEKLPVRSKPGDYTVTSNLPVLKGSEWIDITDGKDSIVFSINPNGNNLGSAAWGVRINNGSIRTDSVLAGGIKYFGYYLDRNFYITPQTQPSTPVSLRFYTLASELQTIHDSVMNKYGRNIPYDSVDVTKETTASTNLDPTNHTGATSYLLLNSSATSYASDYYLQVSTAAFSKFNPSFVPMNPGSVLPVTWLGAEAKWEGEQVVVTWHVAQEYNIDHYEVEFSTDGKHFLKISDAQAVNAINKYTDYYFYHSWPKNIRIGYYRIRQVDRNGAVDYSHIMALTLDFHPSLFPNPATDKLYITFPRAFPSVLPGVSVYDAFGRLVLQETITAGSNEKVLDVSRLPDGVYFLKWDIPGIMAQPFVKSR